MEEETYNMKITTSTLFKEVLSIKQYLSGDNRMMMYEHLNNLESLIMLLDEGVQLERNIISGD